jgi:hypothetical protein
VVSILDERGRGLALGADDYIVKPVTREQLVPVLRRVGVLPGELEAGRPAGASSAAGGGSRPQADTDPSGVTHDR